MSQLDLPALVIEDIGHDLGFAALGPKPRLVVDFGFQFRRRDTARVALPMLRVLVRDRASRG